MNKKTLGESKLTVLRFEKTIDDSGVTKLTPVLLIESDQESPIPLSPHQMLARRRVMRNLFHRKP